MRSKKRLLAELLPILFLVSCASHQIVPTTSTHPPTTPEQVRVYQDGPKKYEVLGEITLEITPDLQWDEKGEATKAFNIMRERAADLGATGIITDPDLSEATNQAIAGYQGQFYKVQIHHGPNTVYSIAQAIYVIEE